MSEKSSFPQRSFGTGLVMASVGYVATNIPDVGAYGWTALVAGGALTVIPTARYVQNRRGTNATLSRWNRTARRHGGTASAWDHLRVSSAWAMRRQAATLKPSLQELTWWARYRVPVNEYATELARAGRYAIWSPNEDVTARFGGPRTGKTGELCCRIIDAPGAVVATLTRTDIVELTAPLRSRKGPIHIFNAAGIGGWASTIKWSPLTGCRVPKIAQQRAADMIPPTTSSEGERWDAQGRAVLGLFLHAAALANLPMRAVKTWTSRPDDNSHKEVLTALKGSREHRSMALSAQQFFGMNDRTKTSITTTMMAALWWLDDSRAAALGDPDDPGAEMADVLEMINQRATIYMLGGEDGTAAPLIAAFTSEIARQARALAATKPGGRLDPSLTIALDEAALICPVPLDRWTADMGGRGITIHISVQSRAQLRQKWGDAGAATILNNTASILVYGGTRDPDDLNAWSKLSGDREVEVENRDADGKVTGRTTRKEPVLPPARIANLPRGHCMVVRRGMPVCIGRTTMVWQRRDVRRANKENPFRSIRETNYADADVTEEERDQ